MKAAMRSERGQVLIIILLVMLVGMTIGLSVLGRTTTDVSSTTKIEESARAFNAAEAGIEETIRVGNAATGGTIPFAPGLSYQVNVNNLTANPANIFHSTKSHITA